MAKGKPFQILLLISVLVISTCGLIYELVAGTLSSYLLGDSVMQFSTVIGTYLFAMGIGSWLSKFIHQNLLSWFVRIEILIGLFGGLSAVLLFMAFPLVSSFGVILYSLVGIIGILVGLEIPLLMRIFNELELDFTDIVSRVFTFDYLGALLASVAFPLLMVPYLGLIRTSLFFGIFNLLTALIVTYFSPKNRTGFRTLRVSTVLSLIILLVCFVLGENLLRISESMFYGNKVVYSKNSVYQRIVITLESDLRLFLNGNLQFCSADEYRYHEALVHPAMHTTAAHRNILVLGGGDGMAVRELLHYPDVDSITLVDLDPELTSLFTTHPLLTKLNRHSFSNPKVKVINQDAFLWTDKNQTRHYDAIVVDFPDPSSFALGKLYTPTMYERLYQILKPGGSLVVQATSPYFAPKSFACINSTIQSTGFFTQPYHCYVPSFGEWGFILAKKSPDFSLAPPLSNQKFRFFSQETFRQMTVFPADMRSSVKDVNLLNNQFLVRYFEEEWSKVN